MKVCLVKPELERIMFLSVAHLPPVELDHGRTGIWANHLVDNIRILRESSGADNFGVALLAWFSRLALAVVRQHPECWQMLELVKNL
jgi:hypothetical protein